MVNKRQQFRVPYGKETTIRLEDGRLITGQAVDINDGGFFLKPQPWEDLSNLVGQGCVLLVDLQVESLELPAQLVRATDTGVGIQFTGKAK